MKMGLVSGGLGIGAKDARTVMIFHNRKVLKEFLDKGWTFGGEAEATAKVEGKGGTAGELEMPEGILVYQLTTTGMMAKSTVVGTKFWRDDELN
jgi:lipid-binding SYLF domain-containing protein